MTLKIGSRTSRLALVQTEAVVDCLKAKHPEVSFEIVGMETTGDKILNKTLDKVGGKGLFIKELEEALAEGRIDLTVHSYKDMPVEDSQEFPVLAVSKRENPFDVLVLPQGKTELSLDRPIGTSSLRRQAQLQNLYPNHKLEPVRGNVITRLEKLDSGAYSALVLAYAGLQRLGLSQRISRVFSPEEMLPSACQGVLAIQGHYRFEKGFLDCFHERESFLISNAERSFLRELNGGCSSPVACYGTRQGEKLSLKGMVLGGDGLPIYRSKSVLCSVGEEEAQGEALGIALAEELKI